jgi:hypothetical protein
MFVSLYLVNYSRLIVRKNYEYKLSLTRELKNENIEALERDFQKIVLLTFVGGIVTGMLGIGGGMITTPLLLKIGLDPKVNFIYYLGCHFNIKFINILFICYRNLSFYFFCKMYLLIIGTTKSRIRHMSCYTLRNSCFIWKQINQRFNIPY